MGATVVIVAEVYLPRPTTHLTVFHIGLDGSAGGIDTDRYDLAAVGTVHLDLGVPGLKVSGLERRFRIFWHSIDPPTNDEAEGTAATPIAGARNQ
jgi:hypothetical protein